MVFQGATPFNRCAAGLIVLYATILFSGQSAGQPSPTTYQQGTCIIAVWSVNALSIASDARTIITMGRTVGVGQNTCKVARASPTTLLAVDGLRSITAVGTAHKSWDGLAAATRIFSLLPNNATETDMLAAAANWQSDLISFVAASDAPLPKPPPPADNLVTLHVFFHVGGRALVLTARISLVAGELSPTKPYLVTPPFSSGFEVLKYGSCSVFLGNSMPRGTLSASELRTYEELRSGVRETSSGDALGHLALGYVELGAEISGRLATPGNPGDVAAPFTVLTSSTDDPRWRTVTKGACDAL